MEKILVIGGNAAGLSAASRAKRLKPSLDILVLEQSTYISYSTCGVPYFISSVVPDEDHLISFSPDSLLKSRGIQAKIRAKVVEIFPSRKRVAFMDLASNTKEYASFDKLIISTGYSALVPSIPGIDLKNVFCLVSLEDGIRIKQALADDKHEHVVLVGAGYVGLEMAETFRTLGLKVTILEKESTILGGIDPDISELIEEELRKNGVGLLKNARITALRGDAAGRVRSVVYGYAEETMAADLVLLDVGVKPNVELAASCGVRLGPTGAIAVADTMQTNVPFIYAAGNCAETKHLVTGKTMIDALGTVAAKQGRVAGENVVGRRTEFLGAVGTCVVKVFDLAIARTGISHREAHSMGYKAIAAKITDHSITRYYPGGGPITIKIVVDCETRRLLGAQMVGGSDVAKRVDVLVAALTNKMRIDEIAQLDLSYTPPYAPLWDPILVAMNAGLRELDK